jgi:hypothetical protein
MPRLPIAAFVDHCKRLGLYGVSAGATGHLFMEYFQSQARIRLRHFAYGSRSRMMRHLLPEGPAPGKSTRENCLPGYHRPISECWIPPAGNW